MQKTDYSATLDGEVWTRTTHAIYAYAIVGKKNGEWYDAKWSSDRQNAEKTAASLRRYGWEVFIIPAEQIARTATVSHKHKLGYIYE